MKLPYCVQKNRSGTQWSAWVQGYYAIGIGTTREEAVKRLTRLLKDDFTVREIFRGEIEI